MPSNPLFDPKTDNQDIHEETQKMINEPLKADEEYSERDKVFIERVLKLVEDGTINLYAPSSLLNHTVYDGLSDEGKGLADQNTVNMLAKIRDIVRLTETNGHPTFQMKNLVESLHQNIERLEEHSGDIFII